MSTTQETKLSRDLAIIKAMSGENWETNASELLENAEALKAAGTDDDTFNVWVSTFGLYNAGNLAGYWTPASEAPEEVPEFVAGLVVRGIAYDPRDVGEEMHCFDIENSPHDGEMSPTRARELAAILETINAPADVLAAWLANGNALDDSTAEALSESYSGTWDSEKEFAQDLAEDIGAIDENAQWPYSCIDWDHATRELMMDYWSADVADGVAIFRA